MITDAEFEHYLKMKRQGHTPFSKNAEQIFKLDRQQLKYVLLNFRRLYHQHENGGLETKKEPPKPDPKWAAEVESILGGK